MLRVRVVRESVEFTCSGKLSAGIGMKSLEDAACVSSDPTIFDAKSYPEADPALAFCAACTKTAVCIEMVRPSKSFFDGVAGGVVWRNGYIVKKDNTTREDRILRDRFGRNGYR